MIRQIQMQYFWRGKQKIFKTYVIKSTFAPLR